MTILVGSSTSMDGFGKRRPREGGKSVGSSSKGVQIYLEASKVALGDVKVGYDGYRLCLLINEQKIFNIEKKMFDKLHMLDPNSCYNKKNGIDYQLVVE